MFIKSNNQDDPNESGFGIDDLTLYVSLLSVSLYDIPPPLSVDKYLLSLLSTVLRLITFTGKPHITDPLLQIRSGVKVSTTTKLIKHTNWS